MPQGSHRGRQGGSDVRVVILKYRVFQKRLLSKIVIIKCVTPFQAFKDIPFLTVGEPF